MNKEENVYCRLCAELKSSSKLLNLQCDDHKLAEIIKKLNLLNAGTDFTDNFLPKTVCFVCINILNTAFDFVLQIQHAQTVLSEIFSAPKVKQEARDIIYSDNDSTSINLDIESLKAENIGVKLESVDQKEIVKTKVPKTKRKRKKLEETSNITNLDALPLSQLKLTWKDYKWTCSYCETQFPTIQELIAHSTQYHNCCNAFRCTDCNIRKLCLENFIIHVKRHRKYLKLSCYKCHKRFKTLYKAKQHRSEHESIFACKGCQSGFESIEVLNDHTKNFFQEKKRRPIPLGQRIYENLTCLLCQKSFKHKGSLHTHLLIHTDRKRDHTCEKCGKCFLNKRNLLGHMVLHDNVRPFQCEICKMSFKTYGQLRAHVGVHDSTKPFACDKCGRCFRLQKQLTSHSIIHTDSLPYICTFCNKAFRFKTILNQHIRQHTGIKPYSCDICQRDFTNWPNYNKHMKRRHGIDMAKKKHTPDGVYPINPVTGEVVILPETTQIIEWKREMMRERRPGRPKVVKVEQTIEEKS